MTESSSRYRYDTIQEYNSTLKTLTEQYRVKLKKYQRRITAIDVTVYSISGVLASAGIILSSVTMTAPVVVPVIISSLATLAGVATAVTKKISSCVQTKLADYRDRYTIVSDAYSKLSTMFSTNLDDEVITAEEFSAMSDCYNIAMTKLESTNNNSNGGITSTNSDKYQSDSKKYKSDTNKDDINSINKTGI